MKLIASRLESIVDQHMPSLQAILSDSLAYKSVPGKWSKIEIIGHMIDSAQNNIRRFIVAQYEDSPAITYQQDDWVALSHYRDQNGNDLINLWQLINQHLAVILKNISANMAQRTCQTQQLHTLEWLAEDYIKHLRHHLHQVLDLEPVAYP